MPLRHYSRRALSGDGDTRERVQSHGRAARSGARSDRRSGGREARACTFTREARVSAAAGQSGPGSAAHFRTDSGLDKNPSNAQLFDSPFMPTMYSVDSQLIGTVVEVRSE